MKLINQLTDEYVMGQLSQFGPDTLTDKELLYCIVRIFCSQKVAQKSTISYFDENHDFSRITQLTRLDWKLLFNNQNKALKMLAIEELLKRNQQSTKYILGQICSSKKVGEYLIPKLKFYQQEVLYVLYLDTKNQIIHEKELFKGTLNQATVHPREIFKFAVQYSAARIIIAHNHPSGILTPSENDQRMTQRLAECGEILGIELLDHLVIGQKDYYSFREHHVI